MFKRDVNARADHPDKIDTVIARGAELKGSLDTPSGLRVDGRIEGSILGTGDVIVGAGAQIVGDIEGRNVSVSGEVRGNISATARLEIAASGIVIGDVNASALVVNEGGKLDGRSQMQTSVEKADEGSQA